jgi:esterase/lipase
MTKIAYLFSGLGSDERAFKYINLDSDIDLKTIRWEAPGKDESVSEYAKRLSQQITSPNAYYIGVSFGGIVAIEVNKHVPAKKIILISSVKEAKELPGTFAIGGKLKLYMMANVRLIQKDSFFVYNMYGVKTKEHRALLMALFSDLDPLFFKWAIKQMMTWKHVHTPSNIIHIHGSNDKAFPFKKINNLDYEIKNGGHFMVFDRASELEDLLHKELA